MTLIEEFFQKISKLQKYSSEQEKKNFLNKLSQEYLKKEISEIVIDSQIESDMYDKEELSIATELLYQDYLLNQNIESAKLALKFYSKQINSSSTYDLRLIDRVSYLQKIVSTIKGD